VSFPFNSHISSLTIFVLFLLTLFSLRLHVLFLDFVKLLLNESCVLLYRRFQLEFDLLHQYSTWSNIEKVNNWVARVDLGWPTF
jgi:hypothetical protein